MTIQLCDVLFLCMADVEVLNVLHGFVKSACYSMMRILLLMVVIVLMVYVRPIQIVMGLGVNNPAVDEAGDENKVEKVISRMLSLLNISLFSMFLRCNCTNHQI